MDIYQQGLTTGTNTNTYTQNIIEAMIAKKGDSNTTTSQTNTSVTNTDINNIDIKSSLMSFLSSMGKPQTSENMNILDFLMSKNMSLDEKSFKSMEDSIKTFTENSFEKATLLLKNEIPLTQGNANQLEGILSKEHMLQSRINELLKELLQHDNAPKIFSDALKGEGIDILLKDIFSSLNELKGNILSETNIELLLSKLDTLPNDISQALKTLASEDNGLEKLIDLLLPNNLITDGNIATMLSNMYGQDNSLSDTSLDNLLKTLLPNLLKNSQLGDNITKENYEQLSKFVKDLPELDKNFANLFGKVFEFQNSLNSKFTLNLSKTYEKNFNQLFKNLKDLSSSISKNTKSETNLENTNEILKSASDIEKSLDFLNLLKDSMYLQIPIVLNNFQTNAEIFVFKDGKKNKNSSKKQSASALVSVDLLNLGQMEIFVTKIEEDISLQFKLGEEFAEDLIKSNSGMLETYLKNKKLKLKDINFSTLDEPFTLLDDEKDFIEDSMIGAKI